MMENTIPIPGLVLEGGAMRGMYTAGILDTWMDMGIEAKKIVGVSAGALFGVNYLSGQKGRAIRYNKRFNPDPDYLGIRPLLREGNIINTEYAYERVPHQLDPFDDETYQAHPSEFYAVITNMETGEPEYIRIRSVFEQMDVLRASGSMPLVSRPVEINGRIYLDGAVADNIPFEWMYGQGIEKIVVILTRDMSYRKRALPAPFAAVYRKKYPLFAEKVARRHELYQRQIEELKRREAEGRAYVIRPSEPIRIGRIEKNPDQLQSVYDLGVQDAKRYLEGLMHYLKPDQE